MAVSLLCALAATSWAWPAAPAGAAIALRGGEFALRLSSRGWIADVQAPPAGRSLFAAKAPAALIQLRWGGRWRQPRAARFDSARRTLELVFDSNTRAVVAVKSAATHLRLTLLEVRGAEPTAFLLRLPVSLRGTVGTIVGVARDERTAVGVQALNIHTTAGALAKPWGAELWATARANQGGVVGAAVALFGCPARDALDRIGRIELAEGLPHPLLDGVWNKRSPTARAPYLVIRYSAANMGRVLALARRGGFKYVYHPAPFKTWGHFVLNPREFPEGERSLRACAEKAAKAGVRLGLHTLSGFITTNDAYVTPVPDPRLARVGSSRLAADVSADAAEIPVRDAKPFRHRGTLATVIMGKELATYAAVRPGSPPALVGVKRGAWGATASPHRQGDDIGKLADHPYRTFFPGVANGMADEMARRIADLFNFCQLRQISFDGLEGLSSYEGRGDYPRNRFVDLCHRRFQQEVISDASNLLHYTWHWHTRMNWGELTQSAKADVDHYRARNCDFFRANLFPTAMGWQRVGGAGLSQEATRLEDLEYLLAKAAGNQAAHALVASVNVLKMHGLAGRMFDLAREWSAASAAGAFTPKQLARLREPGRDFHLRRVGDGRWALIPARYSPFYWICSGAGRKAKPGALTFASAGPMRPRPPFRIANPFGRQPIRFEIRCLPAYDYAHPDNIDLTPSDPGKFARGPGLPPRAPALRVARGGELAGLPALRLAARRPDDRPDTRLTRASCELPRPLNLRRHRGLGLWIDGDGQGETLFVELFDGGRLRQYYTVVDFTGPRYVEFPLGEVPIKRYYDYRWAGLARWHVTLKGFGYHHVRRLSFGFIDMPPGKRVSCRVAGVKALRELSGSARSIRLECAGQVLRFDAELKPFQYLLYDGAGAGQVCDANYHTLREAPARGALALAPSANAVSLSYESAGPAPWLRLECECRGPAEPVGER